MPLVVDRLGHGDLDAALRLSTQAGWNQIDADWRRLLDLSPEGCLAGRLDGRLVATATLASFNRSVHWIGMVLVDEAVRGQGFGSAMLARAIDVAKSRGGVIGLDATDLGRPVYLKQGFVDVAPIDRWSGVLRATKEFRDVTLLQREHFDDVVRLDRASCGVDRSEFLLQLLNEPGVFGVLVPAGYAFLRPGRTCGHVGPIVAKDDADCLSLLTRLSKLADGSPVLLDAIRTPATTGLLDQSGLSVARRLTRMTLGAPNAVLMGDPVRAAVSFDWG